VRCSNFHLPHMTLHHCLAHLEAALQSDTHGQTHRHFLLVFRTHSLRYTPAVEVCSTNIIAACLITTPVGAPVSGGVAKGSAH